MKNVEPIKLTVMISKHINHLAVTALKYFFDIDITHFKHAFAVLFMTLNILQIISSILALELSYSWQTVKEDSAAMGAQLRSVWQKISEELYAPRVAQIKAQLQQINISNWYGK